MHEYFGSPSENNDTFANKNLVLFVIESIFCMLLQRPAPQKFTTHYLLAASTRGNRDKLIVL